MPPTGWGVMLAQDSKASHSLSPNCFWNVAGKESKARAWSPFVCRRFTNTRHARSKTALPRRDAAPIPAARAGRAGNTARSAEAPGFESRRRRPGPQRPPARPPARLPASRRAGPTLASRRPAHRATPPGCTHAAARTAGAWRCGDPGRSLPPPLPRASWVRPSRPTARVRALARSCSRSAGSQVPAAGLRLHLAHRALFLLPHRKAKTIGAAQAREGNGKQEGRRRREVTLASEPGLPGRPLGGQGACAERGRLPVLSPHRRSPPLPPPAAPAQAWPGKSISGSSMQRHQEFCGWCSYSSLRCLPEPMV
ncbi:guanine nucleotide-binding protein G(s) subunit alpha isoforms XLas-like [Onychomys torridus]|uniref:guanine nucleotide-binding protein G(s) subunit alpha isoforms XLas-like n=1 Tax=Onychomys torridus TaxID=38674 RepID=UPI00167F822F|nr:guanine nucleotide-binding protein G(s) subunit alpha isoforms XLas-like [Onychomys torridus]